MKTAKVIARRRLVDGRRLLHVVCPVCDGRHWLPEADDDTQGCPRRPVVFTISGGR